MDIPDERLHVMNLRGRTAAGSLVLIALAAATGVVLTQVGASAGERSPSVTVRGELANPETFSLGTLHSSEDRLWLDSVRNQLFEACMAEKGFTAAPELAEGSSEYSVRYGRAANGDDGTNSESPTTRSVKLPGGGAVEVSTTWTPDSCVYQMFSQLGSDPFYREGLRIRMMILQSQADTVAASQLAEVTAEWTVCAGLTDADAFDLFRAIDGDTAARPDVDQASNACLTQDVERQAREIRAAQHVAVAAENLPVVTAWVALVDQELAQATNLDDAA